MLESGSELPRSKGRHTSVVPVGGAFGVRRLAAALGVGVVWVSESGSELPHSKGGQDTDW